MSNVQTQKKIFIAELERTGVISRACQKANITRAKFREWDNQDPQFRQDVLDAQENASDEGEYELRRRAIHGTEIPVQHNGMPVYLRHPETGELILDDNFEPIPFTVKRQSDSLLALYVKAHKPKYRGAEDEATNAPPPALNIKFV